MWNDSAGSEGFQRQPEDADWEDPTCDEAGTGDSWPGAPHVSFMDQLLSGSWPIRMPITFEIFAEADRPQIHRLEPGQRRRRADSHILTLEFTYDRAKIRELMLEQIRTPLRPGGSRLADLFGLIHVDRDCFLETAAGHFAEQLRATDASLRHDRYLFGFLQDLHEYDGEAIGDLVAATMRVDRAAGVRLRGVILELLDDPRARDALGWLVAAQLNDELSSL